MTKQKVPNDFQNLFDHRSYLCLIVHVDNLIINLNISSLSPSVYYPLRPGHNTNHRERERLIAELVPPLLDDPYSLRDLEESIQRGEIGMHRTVKNIPSPGDDGISDGRLGCSVRCSMRR